MSIVKEIVNADAEARYLSPGELDRIKSFVTGERRLRIAQALTDNRSASSASWRPAVRKTSGHRLPGNAYGQEMTATCLRTWITTSAWSWRCCVMSRRLKKVVGVREMRKPRTRLRALRKASAL